AIENREIDPQPVRCEPRGPDDSADSGLCQIELSGSSGRSPYRLIMWRSGRLDCIARDVVVDQAANAVVNAIGIVEVFRKIVGKLALPIGIVFARPIDD